MEYKKNHWKKFKHTRYGSLLVDFFQKLNAEMAGIDADEKKKDVMLLLNTKKGYWMYKLYEDREHAAPVAIRSDRYVKKMTDADCLKGKLIYLLDDTLTNGFSLLGMYRLLIEEFSIEENAICPIVFALNEKVNQQENAEKTQGIESSFWKKLKYYIRMSGDDMGFFCVQETHLLHAENVSYVTNLPYLKQEDSMGMNYEVILNREQFKKLQQSGELWKFRFNSYQIRDVKYLQGFLIQFQDEQLLACTRDFVEDYVIEGTYTEDDEGNVYLVFVPFVVAKSIDLNRLTEVWELLAGRENDTEADVAENEWTGRYRECIFVLGMLLAYKFKEYLFELTGISLEHDIQMLSEHYSEQFIKTVKKIDVNLRLKPEYLYDKVRELRSVSVESGFDSNPEGHAFSEHEMFCVVLKAILDKKDDYFHRITQNGYEDPDQNAILEMEEMENLLDHTFNFQSEAERQAAVSQVLITFLQSSVCGSKLFFDKKRAMVIKGNRYGEISDLALSFFDLYFYWAVILMIEKKGAEYLKDIYLEFISKLKDKYKDLTIWNKSTTDIDFSYNVWYYKNALENGFQINNKFFYLYGYLRGKTSEKENFYMKEIEKFVEEYE